jgi:hypothetical protein
MPCGGRWPLYNGSLFGELEVLQPKYGRVTYTLSSSAQYYNHHMLNEPFAVV